MVKEREERRRRDREWQLHKAATIARKSKRLWEEVSGCLQNDVSAFNEKLSNNATRQFRIRLSDHLVISREFYPSVNLKVSLNVLDGCIEYKKATRRDSNCSHMRSAGRFGLDLTDSGQLYIMDSEGSAISCEEASQSLLSPIFSLC